MKCDRQSSVLQAWAGQLPPQHCDQAVLKLVPWLHHPTDPNPLPKPNPPSKANGVQTQHISSLFRCVERVALLMRVHSSTGLDLKHMGKPVGGLRWQHAPDCRGLQASERLLSSLSIWLELLLKAWECRSSHQQIDIWMRANATGVLEGGRHPAWGSQTEHTAMQLGRDVEASPDGQMGKWGFMPGAEDTMELNLEHKGPHASSKSLCTCVEQAQIAAAEGRMGG